MNDHQLFGFLAEQLSTSDLSVNIVISNQWQNGGIDIIGRSPPPSRCDYFWTDDLERRTEVRVLRDDGLRPISKTLRQAIRDVHVHQIMLKKWFGFLAGSTASMMFTRYLFEIRVVDDSVMPMVREVDSSPRLLQENGGTPITTISEAIQFVWANPNIKCPVNKVRYDYDDVAQAFRLLPETFQKNHRVILGVLSMGFPACLLIEDDHTPDNFYKGNKKFLMRNIAAGGSTTPHDMASELWDDFDVVSLIMNTCSTQEIPSMYTKCSERLQTDPNILRVGLKRNGLMLGQCPTEVRQTPEFVLMALQNNGLALRFASPHLRSDVNMVEIAVTQNGVSIRYAQDSFCNNYEWALKAIRQNPEAYSYLSKTLRKKVSLFTVAAQKNPCTLKDAHDSFKNRRSLVLLACTSQYDQHSTHSYNNAEHALKYAPETFQNDHDLVLATVKMNPLALQFASEPRRDAEDIVKAAMRKDPTAYQYGTQELKKTNKALALMFAEMCNDQELRCAFRRNGHLTPWRKDKDVAMTLLGRIVETNAKANIYVYADKSLQNDPDVVEQAFVHPYDEGCMADRFTTLWENESFVRTLIDKHIHNPNCNMTPLLRNRFVKQNRDLVLKMLPRCNFHNHCPNEEACSTLTADKDMVLELLRLHPYLFDYTEEDNGWCVPESYKTDADVIGLMRGAKRSRMA